MTQQPRNSHEYPRVDTFLEVTGNAMTFGGSRVLVSCAVTKEGSSAKHSHAVLFLLIPHVINAKVVLRFLTKK